MNKNIGTDIPFKPDVMLIPSWLGYLESGSGFSSHQYHSSVVTHVCEHAKKTT